MNILGNKLNNTLFMVKNNKSFNSKLLKRVRYRIRKKLIRKLYNNLYHAAELIIRIPFPDILIKDFNKAKRIL